MGGGVVQIVQKKVSEYECGTSKGATAAAICTLTAIIKNFFCNKITVLSNEINNLSYLRVQCFPLGKQTTKIN
jgi:hypothetical protein